MRKNDNLIKNNITPKVLCLTYGVQFILWLPIVSFKLYKIALLALSTPDELTSPKHPTYYINM